MINYRVSLRASILNSIGEKYNIVKDYHIQARTAQHAEDQARQKAHDENLDHIRITGITILRYWTWNRDQNP
jgi:hypothetical protein